MQLPVSLHTILQTLSLTVSRKPRSCGHHEGDRPALLPYHIGVEHAYSQIYFKAS